MNADFPVSPPLSLLRAVNDWHEVSDVFWTHRSEQASLLRELRNQAKEIIVWCEMHGREQAVNGMDAAMSRLRADWLEFERQCERAAPSAPEDPRCREALEDVLDAASRLAGSLEDLDQEIPNDFWQGFGDV